MNENIRVSDADREHVVERLREHYAAWPPPTSWTSA